MRAECIGSSELPGVPSEDRNRPDRRDDQQQRRADRADEAEDPSRIVRLHSPGVGCANPDERRAHDVDDRTFIYYPLVEPEQMRRGATRDLLESAFSNSAATLISQVLKHERISKKEMQEIRKIIEESEREHPARRGRRRKKGK